MIVLGLPVPPSLHVSVVPAGVLTVSVELPQLFTTDKTGAVGNGVTVTVTSFVRGQPVTVLPVTV